MGIIPHAIAIYMASLTKGYGMETIVFVPLLSLLLHLLFLFVFMVSKTKHIKSISVFLSGVIAMVPLCLCTTLSGHSRLEVFYIGAISSIVWIISSITLGVMILISKNL